MIASYEEIPKSTNSGLAIKLLNQKNFPFYWHYNSCFELTLINAGKGRRYIGDNISEFRAGELILIAPNLPHSWCSYENKKNCRAVVVHFERRYFGDDFFETADMRSVKKLLNLAAIGVLFDEQTVSKLNKDFLNLPQKQGWQRVASFIEILGRLSDSPNKTISSTGCFTCLDKPAQERFSRVCNYIDTRFADSEISKSMVASQIHMSPSRFSSFFKSACGKSYIEYLNEIRIANACKKLIETDNTITDICFGVGFNNTANFNRHFIRLKKQTPRQYRLTFKQNTPSKAN
jgi:AraC-like DNA-binding protein/mannose-6-phosphate isomerase-like protein (cupin superfamily)